MCGLYLFIFYVLHFYILIKNCFLFFSFLFVLFFPSIAAVTYHGVRWNGDGERWVARAGDWYATSSTQLHAAQKRENALLNLEIDATGKLISTATGKLNFDCDDATMYGLQSSAKAKKLGCNGQGKAPGM